MFLKAPLVPPLSLTSNIKSLRVISSKLETPLLLQVLATSSPLVQVILSRPIEALTLTPGLQEVFVASGGQSRSTRLPSPFLMDTLSIHFDRQ